MKAIFVTSLWLLLAGAGTASAHEPSAEGRYLGNEGILVTACGSKILFDAFYEDSYGQYLLVPDRIRAGLMAGEPPYDDVDALFVSHVHGDHFSPAPTLAYLRAQPDVRLFGTSQVVAALETATAGQEPELMARVTAIDAAPGDAAQTATLAGLFVDVVAIPHAGGARMADIENLAFRVTLSDSLTVLHLGDAVADTQLFAARQPHWDARAVHVAFPPYWFFLQEEGRRVLQTHIRADKSVGVHVPAAARGQGDAWREEVDGDLFTDPGETREVSALFGGVCPD